jgi:hypothetical protein
MSSLKVHTVQSIVTSTLLYPVIGTGVIPFGLSVVFIDVDHLVEYVKDTRCANLLGIFPYYRIIENNLDRNYLALSIFHTIEFFTLIFGLSFIYPVFRYIFAGIMWHMVMDVIFLFKAGRPFIRAYSLIEYIIRSRSGRYETSAMELMRQEGINFSGIPKIDDWLKRWRK